MELKIGVFHALLGNSYLVWLPVFQWTGSQNSCAGTHSSSCFSSHPGSCNEVVVEGELLVSWKEVVTVAKQALVLVDAKAKKVLANPCTWILKACLTRRRCSNFKLSPHHNPTISGQYTESPSNHPLKIHIIYRQSRSPALLPVCQPWEDVQIQLADSPPLQTTPSLTFKKTIENRLLSHNSRKHVEKSIERFAARFNGFWRW